MPEAARTVAAGGAAPLLAVQGLNAWYGESHILHGVDFDIREGEVVTLLGRLSERGDVPAPRSAGSVEAAYKELDALLDRTETLTERTGKTLARLCPE